MASPERIRVWVLSLILLAGLQVLFFATVVADEPGFSPPSGGTPLFPDDILSHLTLSGGPETGEMKKVPVQGMPFTQALEVRTRQRPLNPWDFQLGSRIPTAIHKGDVLWVTLWMRATETSGETHEGFSELSIEQDSEPYDKIGLFDFSAPGQWKPFAWACVSDRDYAPGAAQVCLRAGYSPQVLQIGGFRILNYGSSVKLADLPHTKMTYPGMEPDAPWRKAAEERIEKYRKSDLKVIVKDASGQPVPGATVHIEQLRHSFGFGSCVVAQLIEGSGPDNDRYREIIKNNFSKVVMENDLKWENWDGSASDGHKTTLAALQWLHDQGIDIRGHNLVWPSWHYTPKRLEAFKGDPAGLEQQIEDHIRDEVGQTKGQLTEWDVVNEPYANHDLLDLLPADAMTNWFKLVHQLDPKPVLYLNDYAGLVNGGENSPHKDAFEKTLRQLKEQGAPIGGLGIQAHLGGLLTGPQQILDELDRWAKLSLDIQITEFDLDFDDEQMQAQYTRDFMTAVFSHPSVKALLTWGFWEKAHWRPRAAMYRGDWSLRPNGEVWNDLVLKQWHTELTAPTDASGIVSTRGFLGQYRITVSNQGTKKEILVTLPAEGAACPVTL